jgi:hypothetical protein
MKSYVLPFVVFLLSVQMLSGQVIPTQKLKMEFKPGVMVEEFTPERSGIKRDLPEGYYERGLAAALELAAKKSQSTSQSTATTQVIVTYETPPPANVKQVFEQAASIWASVLASDVPIRISVRWRSLATGVLGSAGAYSSVRNFVGSNRLNTWYPIALAEKMAHVNLNGTDPDIVATFNSDFPDWYIAIDGFPTNKQIDLYSVVLHEMGHGLGFIGQISVTGTQAGYGAPGIFDQFIVNAAGGAVMDTVKYKNPSTTLKTQISSGNLFLTSPSILRNNNGEKAKLYAPTSYTDGSSVYHVDQAKYKVGDPNALMTPQIARGETTREVGPIVTGAFGDFGWYSSNIIADEYDDTEDLTKDKIFTAKVYSDTIWKESSLKLMLAVDKSILQAVSMPLTKSGNTFTYTMPKTTKGVISYYWSGEEMSGKKFVTPAEAPVITNTRIGSYYQFTIGQDTVKPQVIYSNPLKYIFTSQTSLTLPTLLAADNIGIDTIYMEYSINGGAVTRQGFKKSLTDKYGYTAGFNFLAGQLKANDLIKYRIIVKDKAKIANVVNLPSTGSYEFVVLALGTSVKSYVQNFDQSPSADFYLKGFKFTQPSGFSSVGLHSNHPYADGIEESYDGAGGSDTFTNNDAVLLKPITVRSDTAKMTFDEVVLVEPGDAGESFLNLDGTVNRSFFDYVTVQGSNDGGKNWYNFINGWDSNTYSTWLNVWNSGSDVDGNSTGIGTSALVKKREIDLLSSGKFKGGDQVLIRFRLHADVGAHGWGWAIDNLNIQGASAPVVQTVLAMEPNEVFKELRISPNPTNGKVKLEWPIQLSEKELTLSLSDLTGRKVYSQRFVLEGTLFSHEINLEGMAVGNYMIQVQVGDKFVNRRIVLIK